MEEPIESAGGFGAVIKARVPETIAARLQRLSHSTQVSVAWHVRQAITEYLERIESNKNRDKV